MSSTEHKIVAWAEWSRSQNPIKALDYKSPALALMRQNMGAGIPMLQISDDEALRIEAAIVRLKACMPDLHEVLIMYFLYGRSQQAIAKRVGTCRQEINFRIQKAVVWIDGHLADTD
jgi:DNA-directed RNA polymerase specialized sigma24 family protein